MANRVLVAIEKTKQALAQRLKDGIITADQIAQMDKNATMELDMYVNFQELKSIASTGNGPLTLEEGMTIYRFLGESLETYHSQPVEVRVVLLKMYHELLQLKITGRL